MRKWSIETLSLAGVGAVLLLLSALGAVTCREMALARATSAQADTAYERLAWLEQTRAELYRAQGEQQHFFRYPAAANLRRRDAALGALAQRLAQGGPRGGTQTDPRLQALRALLAAQLAVQSADSGAEHALSDAFLSQGSSNIDAVVGAERAELALVKRAEAAQNRRARNSLAVLLLTMAALISYILLRIRRLTVSRQAAYTRLQGNETRYRQIVETAQEGIWLTDTGQRIVFANQRMTAMLACTLPELLGHHVSDFMPEAALRRCCPISRNEDVSVRDLEYRRMDGSVAWAMVGGRLLHDEHGCVSGALVMMTDITERKLAERALTIAHAELERRISLRTAELEDSNALLRAEIEVRKAAQQALAHSEQRLQEIISMMPLALFLKDADSHIVLMNEACEQQWGVTLAELDAQGEAAHFPPEQMAGFLANDRAAFASGRLLIDEELIWNAQLQENRQVQSFKKPLYDGAGQPLMLIAMSVDITERKRNEEALRLSLLQLRELSDHQQTIKEEERKRIALDIHDDLGQNLMALKIDVAMLHARTGASHPRLHQQVGRVLDTIDATIKSVRAIINDLHPSTLELGLCAAVEWLLKQFERRSPIRYQLIILDDSANTRLDNRQTAAIFRVIQESLANILRHAQASAVEVSLNLNAQGITVVIADNGVGMLPGDDGKAASFGLKSIRERIAAFGGELIIDSRAGNGTALSILMPLSAPHRPTQTGPPVGAPVEFI
ncbi:PAS domain S-box protein [Janthinobacterium sp.]|uniref:PAS domain-containing sensor histidine kinase n=1 Tax=Janthinobacterium sp. TaxID=1871054 RepID=UPI00293D6D3F|nr:PAS domain S-box protein [Janthinobacterium sp.]